VHYRRVRFRTIVVIGVLLSLALSMTLYALNDQLVYFKSPSEVVRGDMVPDRKFRMGGLVASGSFVRDGIVAQFVVTDGSESVSVYYTGALPDLFGENRGVVVDGYMNDRGIFIADTVLAKHDERYRPAYTYDETGKKDVSL